MLINTDYRALQSAGQDGLPLNLASSVVAIGNFDGMHPGHQALIGKARELADAKRVHTVAMTFTPHPRLHFRPEESPFLLMDQVQKFEALHAAGATAILNISFDALLVSLTPQEFVQRLLKHIIDASHVVVGNNFVFGVRRSGDIDMLKTLGAQCGIGVTAADMVTDITRERYSSERVREAIRKGRMVLAEDCLGRPWQLRGEVVAGQKRGRTIGFPTANVNLERYVYPKFGVYTARVEVEGEENATFNAVVNIGRKPTVGSHAPLIEVHLLDFNGDLYGKILRITPMHFIRPEMMFMDIEGLKTQIQHDVKAAQGYFSLQIA